MDLCALMCVTSQKVTEEETSEGTMPVPLRCLQAEEEASLQFLANLSSFECGLPSVTTSCPDIISQVQGSHLLNHPLPLTPPPSLSALLPS